VQVKATIDRRLSDRSFVGHPRGLGFLAFAEGWERFSYYGMQALLVLYMADQLLHPGHVEHIAGFPGFRAALERLYGGPLSIVALSSAIFGLYTGLVYLTPIAGGIIADRWLGRTRTITIGALLMAAGHFLMAFEVSFLLALACLVTGVGCFKGNLASQVGALYGEGDSRRADAFQIYLLFINGGVIAAPLIAGTLGEVYGWHYGFAAAGVGMLIALVIYRLGRAWLPPDDALARTAAARSRVPLMARERTTVVVLVLLVPVLAVGAVGNQQIFNSYLLWAQDHIDLVFFGRKLPTTWLVTLDSVLSFVTLVTSLAFWRLWARRHTEPGEITKITLGLFISAFGLLSLAAAAQVAGPHGKAGIGWAIMFHLVNGFGFSNVFPVGLALYARAAPAAVAATLIGVYYTHLFLANNLVGYLGSLIERLSGTQFWLLHSLLVAAAGVVLIIAGRFIGDRA